MCTLRGKFVTTRKTTIRKLALTKKFHRKTSARAEIQERSTQKAKDAEFQKERKGGRVRERKLDRNVGHALATLSAC